jgi:ankyrin repeat protein
MFTNSLVKAASLGDTKTIQMLLESKADINYQQEQNGYTALMAASLNGYILAVNELLKNNADPNLEDHHGETALFIAAYHHCKQITKLLLEKKVNVNHQNRYGFTALHWAACGNDREIVETLLDNKADITLRDTRGFTAQQFVYHHADISEILNNNKKEKKEQDNLISNEILQLIEHLEYWCITHRDEFKKNSELSEVVEHFKKDIIISQLSSQSEIQLEKIKTKLSAFLELFHNETIMIEERITIFSHLNAALNTMTSKNTALAELLSEIYFDFFEKSIISKNSDKLKSLIHIGWLNNFRKSSLLYLAAETGFTDGVKILLEKKEININHIQEGRTPISIAVENNHSEIVYILRNKGADCSMIKVKRHIHNQDILSIFDNSMQEILIKSMRRLDYHSSIAGVCGGINGIVIQKVLSGETGLENLYKLLFFIKQLKLNELHLCLMSPEVKPKEGHIYVKKVKNYIEYKVIFPSGEINDKFECDEMDIEEPVTLEKLQPFLNDIFKITSSRGHTPLSDVQIMRKKHDNLIEQAELSVLQDMKYQNLNELNEVEKITFRNLVLKKTKEFRQLLSADQKQNEDQYIQICALFDAIELIMAAEKYPKLFPTEYPHRSDKDSLDFINEVIRPSSIMKNINDFLIKGFNGAYKKEELALDYFKKFRLLLKLNPSITHPVILDLSSPNHYIVVIYYPKLSKWQLIDVNKMPRDEGETNLFFFDQDENIAQAVISAFSPRSQHAIFRTNVYSLYDDNLDEKLVKKEKLIDIIENWYVTLKPCFEITPEKAQIIVHNKGTYLYLAAKEGDTEKVIELLKMGANINQYACDTPPICMAVQNGHLNTVKAFLAAEQKIDLNLACSTIGSPLFIASTFGKYEIAKSLIEAKNVIRPINPNIVRHIDLQTPLHAAAFHKNTIMVKLLLEAKFEIELNPDPVNCQGVTPLFIAAQKGSVDKLQLLLATNKVDVNKARFNDKYTPLHMAVVAKKIDSVKILLQSDKININLQDKYGYTPLMLANYLNQTEIIEELLKPRAFGIAIDLNLADSEGQCTVLHRAVAYNNTAALQLLLECKSAKVPLDLNPITKDNETPFQVAYYSNNIKMLQLLLTHEKIVNFSHPTDGYTPLHYAAYNNDSVLMNMLLSANAEVNIKNKNGQTPLYLASREGSVDIVKSLLESKKVNLSQDEKESISSLFTSAKNGHIKIIKMLLSEKVNPNWIPPSDGATARNQRKSWPGIFIHEEGQRVEIQEYEGRCKIKNY